MEVQVVVADSTAAEASTAKDIMEEVSGRAGAMAQTCTKENQAHAGLQEAVEVLPRCLVKRCVVLEVWEAGLPLALVGLPLQEAPAVQTVRVLDVKP